MSDNASFSRQSSRSINARNVYMQRHGLYQPPSIAPIAGEEDSTIVADDTDKDESPYVSSGENEKHEYEQQSAVSRSSSAKRRSDPTQGYQHKRRRSGMSDHAHHVYMQRHGLFRKPEESAEDFEFTADDQHSRTDHDNEKGGSRRSILSKENLGDTEKDKKKAEPKASFFALFRFHTRWEIFINILALIPAAGAGAAQPLMSLIFGRLTQDFVDFNVALHEAYNYRSNLGAIAKLTKLAQQFRVNSALNATYMVYLGLGGLVATWVFMTVWVHTSEVAAKRLREKYLRAILRQDIAYFDSVGAGEVTTRIQTDTHLVQMAVSEKVALSVTYLGAFVAGFILAFYRCWRLALAMSSILPVIGLTGAFLNHFISYYLQLSLKHIAEGGTLAEEVLGTIRTAQAFGTQKRLAEVYDKFVERARKTDNKSACWNGAGLAVFFFVIYSAYALAFSFGATLINSGQTDAGGVVNVFLAILIGSFSLALLAPEAQAVTQGQGAAVKLFDTIDRVPSIDSASSTGLKPSKVVGEITFRNVNFTYPSRPNIPIVKNLSLRFPAGKTTALVGASGSGKSTIVNLVERFYDPISGFVELDGIDIKELSVKWLRTQIGLVSQEPTLFATTIRGNVEHGLTNTIYEHASEEKKMALVKEACIQSNAHAFIMKLPLGYNTLVGERGFLMSGGQKQRIAIARAIVSDPRILLLDEATSALDTQSEGIVQNALDKASAGRTTITIAHRLSTIKDAECIHVMGDGEVLQSGNHRQLLRDPSSPYARLVNTQRLREQETDLPRQSIGNIAECDEHDELLEAYTESYARPGSRSSNVTISPTLDDHIEGASHGLIYITYRMIRLNWEDWPKYLIGLVMASLTGLIYPAFGVVFAKGVDAFGDLVPGDLKKDSDRTALWLFIIAVSAIMTTGLQTYTLTAAAGNLAAKVRAKSFRALLRQDITFFDQEDNSTGSLTSSLSENAQKISGMAGMTLGIILQSIATIIGGMVVGLVFAWKIALVAIASLPVLLSSGYVRLRVVILKDQMNKKAHEASAQVACEAAGAIKTVASLTREDDCVRIYSESLEAPLRQSNRTAIWSNFLFAASQCTAFFIIALVFWYGSRLVSFGEYSVFEFFTGIMAAVFGATQAGGAFAFAPDISSASQAGSDVINLIDSLPEIDAESDEGKRITPETFRGRITFDDVQFRYPTRPEVRVLKGISLTVEPGTYIALVGGSGCGKSTCIQLIERFYAPSKGNIYLDNDDIADLNIQDYRKCMALVSQEPTLYAGTVRFNILLGAIKQPEDVTQAEIDDVCRKANIYDFIKSLPDGFDTEVGGKGSQLSGGQKQRIAIARALLRNPKVLLLDEATSALDSNSEKVVQSALDRARLGRTTIAIAHRLSTIQNADCIYFLKEGTISEYGTHDELLRLRGDYYEYVQLQALSGK